jgi:hypothetical protein
VLVHILNCGCSSVGRALAFQAKCREFEPRRPLQILQEEIYMASPKIGENRVSMMSTEDLVRASQDNNNRKHKHKAVAELNRRGYVAPVEEAVAE